MSRLVGFAPELLKWLQDNGVDPDQMPANSLIAYNPESNTLRYEEFAVPRIPREHMRSDIIFHSIDSHMNAVTHERSIQCDVKPDELIFAIMRTHQSMRNDAWEVEIAQRAAERIGRKMSAIYSAMNAIHVVERGVDDVRICGNCRTNWPCDTMHAMVNNA
jgi:hypothetical protein